jgi:hypothetical protein
VRRVANHGSCARRPDPPRVEASEPRRDQDRAHDHFFSIGSCLAYFAFSALTRRSDRRAAIAGAVVTGEACVYALNGFRCPLTDLAERLGSEHGSVADIYLPRWIEAHLPEITGPIFAGAVMLHARNILNSRALARVHAFEHDPFVQGTHDTEVGCCEPVVRRPADSSIGDRPSSR